MGKLNLKRKIRSIPNWPKKGVIFRDITPLLQDKKYFKQAIDDLTRLFKGQKIDKIVGIDARGFLLAAAMAYKLGTGIAIIRKKGKLPHKTLSQDYTLEYGKATVEIHNDAIKKGERVLIVDDVIATGGTLEAAVKLVNRLKGNLLGIALLINLKDLTGLKKLKGVKVKYLMEF